MHTSKLHSQNIIACIWDCDKTLLPDYMQVPLFERYGVDAAKFWREVEQLPARYRQRGYRVNKDTIYLNHFLSYVKHGPLKGLSNGILRETGQDLTFYPGLPVFFQELKDHVTRREDYRRHNIILEHYIISTGLTEIIAGSALAPYVEEIYGCDFIENPLPPDFGTQRELDLQIDPQISQIGNMVDNTTKTRFIFEINKGTNKQPDIDVNAQIAAENRRVPIANMIYIADGPSDIPVFSVVKKYGGRTYAVHHPDNLDEFAQNDALLEAGRIHAYGPADYSSGSSTAMWLKMHLDKVCERIINEQALALESQVAQPPRHLHKTPGEPATLPAASQQDDLFLEPASAVPTGGSRL